MVALGALAALPAFVAYADFILNHFYRYGAVLLDSGLLADLAWHKPPTLPAGLAYGMSYYAYHIAPVFTLLSALSWLVPLTLAQWFALFSGTAQALLAVAVFWLLTTEYAMRHGRRLAAAVVLAVAFSFNGLAIAQIRYPHFEILIAASLMLFLVAWLRRRWIAATLFFALCLICREDAGFHLFAVLFVLTAMNRWNGVPLASQKPALIFLTAGFSYSVCALMLGRHLFPEQSSFARVYLGDPPFGHLTPMVMTLRILGLVVERSYIVLPAVCAVIWAVRRRNLYLLVGYIAFIPWATLNLLAKSDLAGTLSSYYAFPFLVAMFWPLIGWRIRAQTSSAPQWEPVVGVGVMILASFAALSAQHNPTGVPLWRGLTDPPGLAAQMRVERAMTAILADHAALHRILASDSIASLRPDDFRRDETLLDDRPGNRDTVLYFAGDRQSRAVVASAAESGLGQAYEIAGTPIRIVTDVPPAELPALGPLMQTTDRDAARPAPQPAQAR